MEQLDVYEEEAEQPENPEKKEAEEQDPRSTVRFWYDWLDDAEEAAKAHKKRADAAYRDYELGTVEINGEVKEKKEGGFGIYYSTAKHLEAAYYAKTPEARGIRRFGVDDPLANTGSFITERLGTYFIEAQDFDAIAEKGVQDFIHADKASLQVVTQPPEEPDTVEIPVQLVPGPNGQPAAITQTGQPVPIESVVQGQGGYVQILEEYNPIISLLPVGFDEIRHSPNASVESEIKEKAFCITLDEYEVKERFYSSEEQQPRIAFDELPWMTSKDEESREEEEPVKRLKIWEIYCKETKMIYWLCDKKVPDFLDKQENTDRLRGYFPCTPFIISNTPKKGLYPTPAHTHVKPYLDALDKLWGRIVALIPKIERKAILDSKLAEALDALEGDLDYVTVKNLAQMIEGTGDLRGMIQFLPLKELVEAIQEASSLIDLIGRWYNEHIGLPDILRGQADPSNAASTNQTMAQAAHDRFKKQKRAVQTMCRDALELCIDMALSKWSNRKIWKVTGMDYAEPIHQQNFEAALQMLRDDEERFIRIDIETDSTSFTDEVVQSQKAQALSQVITQGLATIGGAQNQEYIPVLLEMLLITVDAMGGAGKHEEDIKQAVSALQQRKQQQGPGGAEGQDPAQMAKAQEQQTKLQVAQMESQVDMAEAQMQMQQHQSEIPLKQAELQLKIAEAQLEREKIQLEYARLGQDKQLQDMKMMETAAKTAGTIKKESLDTQQAEIDYAGKVAAAQAQTLTTAMKGGDSAG